MRLTHLLSFFYIDAQKVPYVHLVCVGVLIKEPIRTGSFSPNPRVKWGDLTFF